MNVGLLSCKKRTRVPLRVRRGKRGRGGENERLVVVYAAARRHRIRLYTLCSVQSTAASGSIKLFHASPHSLVSPMPRVAAVRT